MLKVICLLDDVCDSINREFFINSWKKVRMIDKITDIDTWNTLIRKTCSNIWEKLDSFSSVHLENRTTNKFSPFLPSSPTGLASVHDLRPVVLFCLFWSFSSYSRIFHSYGDVTITGEGLQALTSARHSWPLSSEDSLMCHTYCDTGYPFIMVISSRTCDTHTYCRAFWQCSCHYLF